MKAGEGKTLPAAQSTGPSMATVLFHRRRGTLQLAISRGSYLPGRSKVELLPLVQVRSQFAVEEQDVVFIIEIEAAPIHVGRSNERHLGVDCQCLCVQQAPDILENIHSGFKQRGVITPAGGAHDPGVISCGEDNSGFNASISGGAKRLQHRLVGDEVGRRYGHFLSGSIHHRLKHLRHRGEAYSGTGTDNLRDKTIARGRRRVLQEIGNVLFDMAHPVAGKQVLVLLHYRALETAS